MPELPEVEVTRLGFADRIAGALIDEAVLGKPLRWPLGCEAASLVGQQVHRVTRRGKYLLIHLSSGLLLLHLGMSGSVRFAQNLPQRGVHDHFDLITSHGTLRLHDPRRFGAVVFASGLNDPRAVKLLGRLGVEPLEGGFDPGAFHAALRLRRAPHQTDLAGRRLGGGRGQHLRFRSLVHGGYPPHGEGRSTEQATGHALAWGHCVGLATGAGHGRQQSARFFGNRRPKWLFSDGCHGLRSGRPALSGLRHTDSPNSTRSAFHLLLRELPEALSAILISNPATIGP